MYKKFTISILTLLFIITFTGCSENVYEDYLSSIEKTNSIKQARQEMKIDMTLDFDTTGLSEKEVEGFELASDFQFLGSLKYNTDQNIFENNIYLKMGSIGFDVDVFGQDDEILVKLVNLGKYFKIDTKNPDESLGQFNISDDTMRRLNTLWQTYINENNIFKGENILIDTPSGVVKSKKYSIELDDNANQFIQDAISIIHEDQSITWFQNEDFSFDMSKATIDYFISESYVDKDGYIVKEQITFKTTYDLSLIHI